jgi:tetratricopeptide (TPR) repeat protein
MLLPSWIKKNLIYNGSALLIIAVPFAVVLIYSALYPAETFAIDAGEAFSRANLACETGEYDKAISGYESILNTGLKSGELYYNIANCYLNNGSIGKAILNYKRAMRFIPRDSALLINYRYALSQMKQRDVVSKEPYPIIILRETFDFFTLKETFLILIIFYYLTAAVMIIKKFAKTRLLILWLTEVVLILTVIIVAMPLSGKINDSEKEAVVLSKTTDAKLEPMDEAASIFPLYEGMKVYILRAKKDWCKVKRPDGKIGWVVAKGIESVTSI